MKAERPLTELQGEHAHIEAAYVAYQTALMACDRARALAALARLRQRLAAHADLEDALLMPLYAQEYAQSPLEGGSPRVVSRRAPKALAPRHRPGRSARRDTRTGADPAHRAGADRARLYL